MDRGKELKTERIRKKKKEADKRIHQISIIKQEVRWKEEKIKKTENTGERYG